jgi:two-component system phosphate regulon response regulator PhoB
MKNNIYLLEDDDDITTLVSYLTGEIGLDVSTHGNIASLRSSLAMALPDLFILDIMLPDGSGLDVCRSLKLDAATRLIPVLMMSAHANGAELAKAAAADDFIAKPFGIDEFTAKVQRWM